MDAPGAAIEPLLRMGHALLKGRSGGDRLEDRSGLKGIGDRAVPPLLGPVTLRTVRIEHLAAAHGGTHGEGEDLAGPRVHDDADAAARVMFGEDRKSTRLNSSHQKIS